MAIHRSPFSEGLEIPSVSRPHQRVHPRFRVQAQVVLAGAGMVSGILACSQDISWGGASLMVPTDILALDDSTALRFPWLKGSSISALAKIAWRHQIADRRFLLGVSFSQLTVDEEGKLCRLLSMLMRSNRVPVRDVPYADQLQIHFLDRTEMLATLRQVRSGYVETTALKRYLERTRIRLVLAGFSNLPSLHLRARVLWQRRVGAQESAPTAALSQVGLALEHPLDDLKRVIDLLIEANNSPDESA